MSWPTASVCIVAILVAGLVATALIAQRGKRQ